MEQVARAVPEEDTLLEQYYGIGVPLYTAPDEQAETACWLEEMDLWRDSSAIGLVGEDWLHIVLLDGRSGYMKTAWFGEGNG